MNTEWRTPQKLFDEINKEFRLNVDVCATPENSKCRIYCTEEINGLLSNWSKWRCWMNPPYDRSLGRWIEKAYHESLRGALVVGLLPAKTDTQWFHKWILGKAEIRFLQGRVHFEPDRGRAPFGCMIVIWRSPIRRGA